MYNLVCIHCKRNIEGMLFYNFNDLNFNVDLDEKKIEIYGEEIELKKIVGKIEELGYIVER